MKKFGKKILALFLAVMCIATIGVVSASAANYYRPNDNVFRNNMKRGFSVSQNSPSRKKYGKFFDNNYLNTHKSVSAFDVNSWR